MSWASRTRASVGLLAGSIYSISQLYYNIDDDKTCLSTTTKLNVEIGSITWHNIIILILIIQHHIIFIYKTTMYFHTTNEVPCPFKNVLYLSLTFLESLRYGRYHSLT
jgi:hypothetical protein